MLEAREQRLCADLDRGGIPVFFYVPQVFIQPQFAAADDLVPFALD